jgi:hypothetical protein
MVRYLIFLKISKRCKLLHYFRIQPAWNLAGKWREREREREGEDEDEDEDEDDDDYAVAAAAGVVVVVDKTCC